MEEPCLSGHRASGGNPAQKPVLTRSPSKVTFLGDAVSLPSWEGSPRFSRSRTSSRPSPPAHRHQQRHRLSCGCRSQGGQGGARAWAAVLTRLRARAGRCVLSRECGEAGRHPSRTPGPYSQSPVPHGQASCVAAPLSGPGRRAGAGGDRTCPAGLPVFSVAPGSPDGSQLTYHLPAPSTSSDPRPREVLPEGQDGNTKEGHR